mmetsp:Transcript_8738/g.32229  ORF Transcript_8738/g.32229 Transcript_8738/m.32229 type:complete len:114 (-) Transcript_8738:1280-1621(-)
MSGAAGEGAVQVLRLYRNILRLHRLKMTGPMRELGDSYVREEFKNMKANAKSEHWAPFVTEWQNYLAQMSGMGDHVQSSGDLTEELLESMNPEQRQQLARLRKEASDWLSKQS